MSPSSIQGHLTSLSRGQRTKLTLIVFFLGIAVFMVYHHGRMSGFDPEHIMIGRQTLESGGLTEHSHVERTPGFYTYTAALFAVTGLSDFGAVFYPLLYLPFCGVLYIVARRFSRSRLFAVVCISVYVLAGADGRVAQLRLHSMGYVLLFVLLFLLLIYVDQTDIRGRRFPLYAGMGAAAVALPYISYNRTAEIMLTVGWIVVLITAIKVVMADDAEDLLATVNTSARGLYSLLFAMTSVIIFVHTFFAFAVPYLLQELTGDRANWIDTIITLYAGGGRLDFPPGVIWSAPESITYLSGLRYAVVLVSLLLFVSILGSRIIQRQPITAHQIVLFGFTAGMATFAGIRAVTMSNLVVTYAFLPGLFATALLFSYRSRDTLQLPSVLRQRGLTLATYAVVGLALLLITSVLFVPILHANNGLNDEEQVYRQLSSTAAWHNEYTDGPVKADLITEKTMELHTDGELETDGIHPADVQSLLGVGEPESRHYYALNTELQNFDIRAYLSLQSWDLVIERVNSSESYDKVYDDGDVKSYRT